MTYSPPIQQRDLHAEPPQKTQLKVLSILWYVAAGLNIFGICGGGFYLVLGMMAFSDPTMFGPQRPGDPSPEFLAWVFTGIGGLVVVLSVVMGILSLFVGINLARRRRFVFCVVVSAIMCLSVPLGTALGVFTLVTLYAAGVKQSFTSRSV